MVYICLGCVQTSSKSRGDLASGDQSKQIEDLKRQLAESQKSGRDFGMLLPYISLPPHPSRLPHRLLRFVCSARVSDGK